MLHGSQGCTAFGKVFLVRHFREPIPLQTSAMDQVSSVMGADDNVVEGLKTICEKSAPDLVGVPTTGLAETQGADIRMAVGLFRAKYPQFAAIPVVPVSTPDFTGSMQSGFALALRAVIDDLVPAAANAGTMLGRRPRQVNVLAGAALTPGDLEHLEDLIELFRLRPVRRGGGPAGWIQRAAGIHGAEMVGAVAPVNTPVLKQVRAEQVKIGDREDLELTTRERGAEVLIGNSHAVHTAERRGIPCLRAGFPLYDQLGGYQRTWIGYQGTRQKECGLMAVPTINLTPRGFRPCAHHRWQAAGDGQDATRLAPLQLPNPLEDAGRGGRDSIGGSGDCRRVSEGRRALIRRNASMTPNELKDPEKAVKKARRIATEKANELHDLVEGRLPAAYEEIPVISQATYGACRAWADARLRAAEAAAA
jgi:hypothetical protein